MEKIGMLNIPAQHSSIQKELHAAVLDAIDTGQLLPGESTREFEGNFAAYSNRKAVVGVASGSAALQLSLLAAGIGPGDEVITVPNSFFATTEAILLVGATPVFCDIEPTSHLMDVAHAAALVTQNTKAILPVHLYGHVVDIAQLRERLSAVKQKIWIIEDCAHAVGASLNGAPLPLGDIGAFSFNPTKNIGGLSDAGAVVTDDEEIAKRVRSYRDHGRKDKNTHNLVGFNSRLSTINARTLNIKLRYLDKWNDRRRAIAAQFDKAFGNLAGISFVQSPQGSLSSYHQYVVCTPRRDQLSQHLADNKIATGIHYPTLITQQEPLDFLGCNNDDLPVARSISNQILSLPCHPELTDQDAQRIIDAVLSFETSQ